MIFQLRTLYTFFLGSFSLALSPNGSLLLPYSFPTKLKAQSFLSLISFRKTSISSLFISQIFQLCHSFYPAEILLKYILNKANMSLQNIFSYQLLKRKKMVCVYSMVKMYWSWVQFIAHCLRPIRKLK